MKKILGLVLILLSGCDQLTHGQIQPVKMMDAKNGVYKTTCAGAVEDWPSCYDKASNTCNRNYTVLSKEDDSRGTRRDLTFQCRK